MCSVAMLFVCDTALNRRYLVCEYVTKPALCEIMICPWPSRSGKNPRQLQRCYDLCLCRPCAPGGGAHYAAPAPHLRVSTWQTAKSTLVPFTTFYRAWRGGAAAVLSLRARDWASSLWNNDMSLTQPEWKNPPQLQRCHGLCLWVIPCLLSLSATVWVIPTLSARTRKPYRSIWHWPS